MKDHHNQSPRSTSRSKSPKPPSNESHRRQPHHSGSRSKRHHHHHPHDAVIFPPDPKEKGVDVINRIYRSFGLTDKFPQDCQQQLQEILTVDPCGPEFMEPTKQDDDDDDDDGWTTTHPKDRHHNKSASATASSVKLKDLTHLPYITIDNDDSMDLDQAMYICWAKCPPLLDEKDITEHSTTSTQAARNFHESFVCPEGGQEENPINKDHDAILVSYALADGAYFVPALSPLFQHALRRGGTSFYLPTKSIPMLPRELSEDRMSLRPNRKRRALVLDMYLRATDASVIRTFYRYAVVQSRWKGSYRQVSEYYDAMDNRKQQQQPTHWIVDETFRETIDLLRVVGQKRIRLAKQRNVVQYDRGSGAGAVTIDPRTGLLTFQATTRERYSSEKYNEQISLLCNMEGAKMLAFLDDLEEKIPGAKDILHPIYRTQSGPRGDQTETLEHVIVNTLQVHGLDAAEWKWRRDDGETLASYLERLRDHVDAIDGDENPNWKQKWKRVVMVIDRQAQITNQAASFSASPEDGHHALKANYYARFSSPMRELVGCYTHKELLEAHLGRFSNEHLSVKKDIERKSKKHLRVAHWGC
jgi:exoribonuclease R